MRRLGQLSFSLLLLLLLAAPAAWSNSISMLGTFGQDDDHVIFQYRVPNTGLVTVQTTSYVNGGFSPVLTLFDSIGNYLFDDSGYAGNRDAQISWNSLGGAIYFISLTEWDNVSVAAGHNGNLSEGFVEDGMGNFTAAPPFNPPLPGGFYLPGPVQLTGNWALTFSSADPGLEVFAAPEPGSFLLFLGGAAVLTGRRRLRKVSLQLKFRNN